MADIARLDFHDFFGKVFDRTKSKTTEKEKGVMMIDKIRDRFSLNQTEEDQIRAEIRRKAIADFDDMRRVARDRKIEWTRDERGNIISPFSKKR